jgi:hypothetical protein
MSRGILLPPIPAKLWQIDETTVGQHFLLEPSDLCFYIWEYTRRGGFTASPTNSLISNLKKKPSKIARNPPEGRHKDKAIAYAASALRALIKREWIETQGTLVPIPCSKIGGHVDHDDRLNRVLHLAFDGYGADIRALVEQTRSTEADHESTERQKFHELAEITRINEAIAHPTRSRILLFDDVLNSGKHFKVAQQLLAQRFPKVTILSVFLARCLPDPPIEFDVIPDQ